MLFLSCISTLILDKYLRLITPVAQHSMAPQLLLQLAALMTVDPTEHLRVGGVGATVRHPVSPVLRQAVLLRHRSQARTADGDLEHKRS